MSQQEQYLHEDIEALLMSKSYGELLQEEKAFVLQHVRDESEYKVLRELLLQMHELSFDAELKDPPESLETALLHGFAENAEKVKGYQQRFAPWMGWALAACIAGFCVIFFWPSAQDNETASVQPKTESSEGESKKDESPAPQPVEPKPAVSVPTVILPSDVENLLAQVVPASTPAAPPYAQGLYEYEDALKAVSLTQEESAEDLAPVTYEPGGPTEESAQNDAVMSAPPAMAEKESVSRQVATTASKKTVTAETKALGKANRKKSRNPEVLKLSQSKKLKALLRSE
jgi:hypothetical protein